MIGGFIIDGAANKDVVFRALGPSLADLGVKKVLSDPSLEVYNSAGALVQQNDNWTTLPPGTVPPASSRNTRPSPSSWPASRPAATPPSSAA